MILNRFVDFDDIFVENYNKINIIKHYNEIIEPV